MKKIYNSRTIQAAIKRLDHWKRQELKKAREGAKRDLIYYQDRHQDTVEAAPSFINKRILKAHGMKAALIDHKNKYILKKYNSVLNLLKNDSIEMLENFEHSTNWTRSRVWGYNPHAQIFINNRYILTGTASGCGYDKLSAAIMQGLNCSDVFNKAFYIYILKKQASNKSVFYGAYKDGLFYSLGGCGWTAIRDALQALGLNKNVFVKGGDTWDAARMER